MQKRRLMESDDDVVQSNLPCVRTMHESCTKVGSRTSAMLYILYACRSHVRGRHLISDWSQGNFRLGHQARTVVLATLMAQAPASVLRRILAFHSHCKHTSQTTPRLLVGRHRPAHSLALQFLASCDKFTPAAFGTSLQYYNVCESAPFGSFRGCCYSSILSPHLHSCAQPCHRWRASSDYVRDERYQLACDHYFEEGTDGQPANGGYVDDGCKWWTIHLDAASVAS